MVNNVVLHKKKLVKYSVTLDALSASKLVVSAHYRLHLGENKIEDDYMQV